MGKFPLGSVLSAGSSLIGSVIGGIDAAKSRQWQTREREASQRYNTSEREASQLYNTSERKSSQAFQTSEREAQNAFSEYMYNQYSSPQALAAQYSRSGLNPRLAMGGSSVGNATAGSGSSGGAPSGSAPSGSHVGTPSAPITFGQGFQDMAASFAALAQAKKAGVDAKLVEDTAQDIAEGYKLDNAGKKLVNSINTVDLSIKQQTALRQALATLTSTEAETEKKRKEIDNLVQQGIITRKEAENWDEEFVNRQSNIKSQTAVNNAEVSLKKTQEWLSKQQGLTETYRRDLMSAMTRAHRAQSDLTEIDLEVSEATTEEQKRMVAANLDVLYDQQNYLQELAAKARKENDLMALTAITRCISQVAGAISDIMQARSGMKIANRSAGSPPPTVSYVY